MHDHHVAQQDRRHHRPRTGARSENEQDLILIAFHLDAAAPRLRQEGESLKDYADALADELDARIVQYQAWHRQAQELGRPQGQAE